MKRHRSYAQTTNDTVQIIKGGGSDRLSELPKPILDSILSLLPIKDAVGTSVLSHNWKHVWTKIPHLTIDLQSVLPKRFPYRNSTKRHERFIYGVNQIFIHHKGAIQRFKLDADFFLCHNALDMWIFLLVDRKIEELILCNKRLTKESNKVYEVPCLLFNCNTLKLLEIVDCKLKPPPNFKGFSNMRTLKLTHCVLRDSLVQGILKSPFLETLEICDCKLKPKSNFDGFPRVKTLKLSQCKLTEILIEGILTKSDCLEFLLIDDCWGFNYILVSLPNLRVLHVKCAVSVHLEKTPKLGDVLLSPTFLCKEHEDDYRAALSDSKIFQGDLLHVATLSLGSLIIRVLGSIGINWYSVGTFENLSKLEVGILPIEARDRIMVSKLLRASPYLKKLIVGDDPYKHAIGSYCDEDKYWETQATCYCLMHHLETIHISVSRIYPLHRQYDRPGYDTKISRARPIFDTKFAKFLLVHSRVLKKMRIHMRLLSYHGMEDKDVIREDLMQVKWASPHVDLIFP
ncbi:hypothetical protein AMTR_s00120p00048500 [Amborella trichopoda]|uniref:F-box domain-containing protein n=2 Tax=Amborella trichopoda TaxID=13333 RepID=W1NSZ6_AMBTC|nr:hypothetical protein AMTR_s00120p00048500 [Amborella trichopoda]